MMQPRLEGMSDRSIGLSALCSHLMGRQGELSPQDLADIHRLAIIAVSTGFLAQAIDVLRFFESACRRQQRILYADYATLEQMYLFTSRGDIMQALSCMKVLRESFGDLGDASNLQFTPDAMLKWEAARKWTDEDSRPVLFAMFYLTIGRLLAAGGSFTAAAAACRRGLDVADKNDAASCFRSPIRVALARALLERGDLNAAVSQIELARQTIDPACELAYYAQTLEVSAHVHLLSGRFADAERELVEVVSAMRDCALPHAEMRARLNLAHVWIFLHQTDRALEALEDIAQATAACDKLAVTGRIRQLQYLAKERARALEGSAPSVADVWHFTATVVSPAQPIPHSPAIRQSESFLAWLDERQVILEMCLGREDWRAAALELRAIHRHFGQSDSRIVRLRLCILDAMLDFCTSKYADAASVLRRTYPEIEALGLLPDQWQILRLLLWCSDKLGDTQDFRTQFLPRWSRLLHQMSTPLPTSERLVFLTGKWWAEEEFLEKELELWTEQSQPDVRGFLHRAYSNRRLLAGPPERHDRCHDVTSLATSSDTAVLFFVVLARQTLIVWVCRNRLYVRAAPTGRDGIRNIVGSLHAAIREDMDDRAIDAAARLAQVLCLSEVLPLLPPDVTRLIIVPDDSLHGFPFAMLPCEGGYLVERFAISAAYHTSPRQRSPHVVHKVLLAPVRRGVPEYPEPSGINDLSWFYGLPWICSRPIRVDLLANRDINRESLAERIASVNLFHFVGHGEFDPSDPNRCGLVLVPTPDQVELFSLEDMTGLRCPEVEHITLAACWGADSYVQPGRYTIGLAERFCRAGAGSVLASLWPAEVESAHALTVLFYRLLSSRRRDEALQLAQQECIRAGFNIGRWAGWQLYGEPGCLPLAGDMLGVNK